MAGLSRRYCDSHGLRIAHFADHNDVWRLAQGGPQRRGKIWCVYPNFDLLDQAAKVDVLILDRIFDGDDVPGISLIDQINQGSQCRGFSRPCRATNQNQSPRQTAQSLHHGREIQFTERGYLGGKSSNRGSRKTAFAVQIDPKPSQPRHAIGRVCDLDFSILPQPVRGQRRDYRRFDIGPAQVLAVNRPDLALQTDRGRSARNEQKVAAGALDQHRQPLIQAGDCRRSLHLAIVPRPGNSASNVRMTIHVQAYM